MDFNSRYKSLVELINKKLDNLLAGYDCPQKSIYDAMRYSLMAGGKRLRPALALAVCEMLNGEINDVLVYACAIEMIHTYSLIHDDLPAMDNDDYRRGRLTNHKVFGEAKAILAGDALLNYAFEIMLDYTLKNYKNIMAGMRAMSIIAKASGVSGMIGGQVIDLESEGMEISEQLLEYMHKYKTGALIKASITASAVLNDASEEQLRLLEKFAEKIGLAFQIQDDILDIEGDPEVMGKKSGSDVSNKKSTYVTLFGLEESRRMADDLTNQALNYIEQFGERAFFLESMAKYLVVRKK